MQITFSQRERLVIFAAVSQVNDWGGSEEALLVRDEMFTALRLDEFEGDSEVKHDLLKMSQTQKKHELSRAAAEHFIAVAVAPGKPKAFGRVLAPAVRRVRSALGATKAAGATP